MDTGLIGQIENYEPYNEQEQRDKELILQSLYREPDIFTRENTLAHMTASAWVVNKQKDKVLMVYHNIYHSWSWLGGHADGETDLLKVTIREVQEESGVQNVIPLSENIFSLESLTVDGHMKKGTYVSSHLHLNVTYLLEADPAFALRNKPDENRAVEWISVDELDDRVSEVWMKERIYSKLVSKLNG